MTDVNDREQLIEAIKQVIAAEGMIDIEKIQADATLESLNLQSIDVVMILSGIEDKFGVYIPVDGELSEAKDVKAFIEGVAKHIVANQADKA